MTPRLLTRSEAADYCGYSPRRFSDLVRENRLPGPTLGHKWDIRKIDAWLDGLSGLASNAATSPLAKWKAQKDARAS